MTYILFLCLALGVTCYFGMRLPKSVKAMTEEEYEQYFRTSIMGMK